MPGGVLIPGRRRGALTRSDAAAASYSVDMPRKSGRQTLLEDGLTRTFGGASCVRGVV